MCSAYDPSGFHKRLGIWFRFCNRNAHLDMFNANFLFIVFCGEISGRGLPKIGQCN